MGKPVLSGERFEKIMDSLSPDQRNSGTASTVMLVAEVTNMKNTVVEDLARESDNRQREADSLHENASNLRRQATVLEIDADGELVRKGVVEDLRSLLSGNNAPESSASGT